MEGNILDYLRALEELTEHGRAISNGAVAELLHVRPASVTEMFGRLCQMGLAAPVSRGRIELTTLGRREARRRVRRHRLAETWLVRSLGLDWPDAHREAHRLEHAISPELERLLSEKLGQPRFDPHGAEIPDADGALPEETAQPFAQIELGSDAVLCRMNDRDAQKLAKWRSLGLQLGVTVRRLDETTLLINGRKVVAEPDAMAGTWYRQEIPV